AKNSAAQTQMPIGNPVMNFLKTLEGVNYVYILGCFIFYFLSGYLLYSALFAAVGSAVDSETETQQFMFPITLPLLFTYILS
ncbi:ABC transporter permease, partial [Pseudomonas chengduensis]